MQTQGRESLGIAGTQAPASAPASPRRYRLPSDETPTGNAASSTSFASARTPPPLSSPSIRCLGSIVGEAPPLTPLAVGAEHRPRSSPHRFHPNRARDNEVAAIEECEQEPKTCEEFTEQDIDAGNEMPSDEYFAPGTGGFEDGSF
ncbi:uncharacterized protein [Oryza sativa Japonica Group]|uniref:Os10g0202900 protein n=2 Tax=Oryza sativa subsp. japonica TaxID=39947 RepID=Q8S645_ORYSJ|nr:uncharacterized protein LOC4348261 [Oryza sativa Japonica Group]AAL86514.1 unknown protein [Oryza sativa Japonica Group]KAB8112326.1 hypothetical protein EE612_050525 [Oryza sativa]BAT10240.1 Os10g0202900 [Oryza sativa Japonica Group]